MSGTPGRLHLRPARFADAGRLLEWANDPATRAASFGREPIEWAAHVRWLGAVLADPDRRLWIAEEAGTAVGQVRVDRTPDGVGVVSLGLGPAARGRGLGRALLGLGLAAAVRELGISRARAVVRSGNLASRRLFEGAGFTGVVTPDLAPAHPDGLVLERDLGLDGPGEEGLPG
ncbi:MAG TPA: GNAT family N-acetyltransferase [Patescibacteria group bacterium]|nr:GNAT family N-acetyltransferase [Patescibacteria group bacterium]